VQSKVNPTRLFADQRVIGKDNLAYTTQTDLIEQESNTIAKLTDV
jgi:hypothetical protein